MDVFEKDGKKTLFSVVSSEPEKLDSLVNTIDYKDNYQIDQIETIDQQTMMQIQKLVDAGILLFTDKQQSIYQTKQIKAQQQSKNKQWIDLARKQFSHAEHQQKMADLLFNGGFVKESLLPLLEAMELALSCLYLAVTGKNKNPIDIVQIEKILIPRIDLDDGIIPLILSIRDESKLLSNDLYQDVNNSITMIDEKLLKLTMKL